MTGAHGRHAGPAAGDPYLPGHGDETYDVSHYDIAIDYRLDGNALSGKAAIHAVANVPLSNLTLDLAGLRVDKLRVDGVGGRAKFVARGRKVAVSLADEIGAGSAFVVHVAYSGNPAPAEEPAGDAGWEELADGVIVAGQPGGAPTWFPCNDRPSSKASYGIAVTAPSDYHVVANGRLTGTRRGASSTTWTYAQPEPMATYLATVQIGRYVVSRIADQPMPIDVVIPPGLLSKAGASLGRQGEMAALFERLFGPYPFDAYTVVVTDDVLEIPLEAQTLSIFGRNFLSPAWDSVRLVAHELAHQWFGNSVTLGSWRDIWLHEGFACYSEWLWSEESGGPSAHQRATDHWNRLSRLPQDLVLADPGPKLMFDDRVYKRGALTLHALRLTVGDDAFFDLLRSWSADNRFGTVSTADFVDHAQASTGADLDDLFTAWLADETLPPLPSLPS